MNIDDAKRSTPFVRTQPSLLSMFVDQNNKLREVLREVVLRFVV